MIQVWRWRRFLTRGPGLVVSCVMVMVLAVACSHVPLSSVVKMSAFRFETTDPAQLRVAVRHPDWIRIPPGGAVMVVEERSKPSGALLYREELVFEQIASRSDLAGLAAARRPGFVMTILRVAASDTELLRALQERLRNASAEERASSTGSLSVSVTGCRTGPAPSSDAVLVSTYLAAGELDGFVTLVRDFDLRSAMADAGMDEGEIGPCANETSD